PRGASSPRDARAGGCGARPRVGGAPLLGRPMGAPLGTARRLDRRGVGTRNGSRARGLDLVSAHDKSVPSAREARPGARSRIAHRARTRRGRFRSRPRSGRSLRRGLALGFVALALVGAWIAVRDVRRGYWSARGANVTRFTIHSRLV